MTNVNHHEDPMPAVATPLEFGTQLGDLINNPSIARELAEKLGIATQQAVKDLEQVPNHGQVLHTYMAQPGHFTYLGEKVHGFRFMMSIMAEDAVERGMHCYLVLNSTFDHVKALAREEQIQEWVLDLSNQA